MTFNDSEMNMPISTSLGMQNQLKTGFYFIKILIPDGSVSNADLDSPSILRKLETNTP